MIPRIIVASSAATLDLTLLRAHAPKALEPPDRFIMATIIPSTTRKIRIPTFHVSERDAMIPNLLSPTSSYSKWLSTPSKSAPA